MGHDGRRRREESASARSTALSKHQDLARAPVDGAGGSSHGAGWHASTWDLQHGLEVHEGLPDDALPDERLMAYLIAHGLGP